MGLELSLPADGSFPKMGMNGWMGRHAAAAGPVRGGFLQTPNLILDPVSLANLFPFTHLATGTTTLTIRDFTQMVTDLLELCFG